jgi:hypothetical protein
MEIATKDPEYRELRWRITAQEFQDAVNMAREAGLYGGLGRGVAAVACKAVFTT